MASPHLGSVPPKLSFAKVAAMNAPHVPPPNSVSNTAEEKRFKSQDAGTRRKTMISTKPPPPQSPVKPASTQNASDTKTPEAALSTPTIETLVLVDQPHPSLNGTKSAGSGYSAEDEQSQLSTSSTKQHSFDTKSMASVTTFAMDEKESIRPDDSASVRAVDDDEVASSLSRNATFHTEPDVIMPALRGGGVPGAPTTVVPVRRFHTLTNPPRFGTLEEPFSSLPDEVETTVSSEPTESRDDQQSIMAPPPVPPDEKLLDALASPKDRLSLLQLEEKLLSFISQTAVDFIDLPPQHSYARLLAHKLADYYNLQHYINEDGQSIRVFRTATLNLPTSLATLAKSIPVGSSQSLGLTAVKIMRRAGLPGRQFSTTESTAASSSVPSKATSEAGHSEEGLMSPTEASTPSRDRSKLTREEREAQYKVVRERIFGNMEDLSIGEQNSTGDNSASLSRSSSSSGKKKNRKQKTPKDDSFDSRSAFVASYGPMHVQQMPSYQSQPYADQAYPNQYDTSPSVYGPQANYSSTPTQAYPGFEQNMQFNNPGNYGPTPAQNFGNTDAWSPMQSPPAAGFFNYPQQPSGYQQNMGAMMPQMNPQFTPQQQPNVPPTQTWNNQYQSPYQQPVNPQIPNLNWQGYQSYPQQYGHGQMQGGQMQSQYPQSAQGSYAPQHSQPSQSNMNNNQNRAGSLFNPQTKTFIPSNAPSRTGNRPYRKKNSPPVTNNQSRQNSVGKPHSSNNISAINSQSFRHQDMPVGIPQSSRNVHDSLQQKYGKPANLPKKPPPPQMVSQFDAESIQGVRNISGNLSTNGGGAEVKED